MSVDKHLSPQVNIFSVDDDSAKCVRAEEHVRVLAGRAVHRLAHGDGDLGRHTPRTRAQPSLGNLGLDLGLDLGVKGFDSGPAPE